MIFIKLKGTVPLTIMWFLFTEDQEMLKRESKMFSNKGAENLGILAVNTQSLSSMQKTYREVGKKKFVVLIVSH